MVLILPARWDAGRHADHKQRVVACGSSPQLPRPPLPPLPPVRLLFPSLLLPLLVLPLVQHPSLPLPQIKPPLEYLQPRVKEKKTGRGTWGELRSEWQAVCINTTAVVGSKGPGTPTTGYHLPRWWSGPLVCCGWMAGLLIPHANCSRLLESDYHHILYTRGVIMCRSLKWSGLGVAKVPPGDEKVRKKRNERRNWIKCRHRSESHRKKKKKTRTQTEIV